MGSSRSRRFLAIVIGLALTAGLFGGPALAGKPLYNGNQYPMTLSSQDFNQTGDWPGNGNLDCLDEDDKDTRWYNGYLRPGESFSPDPTRFCSPVTDGFSDGNTGAILWLEGDTHYRVEWWLVAPQRIVDGQVISETFPLSPVRVDYRDNGKGYELWWGCEAKVPGTVYLTITNIGPRTTYTVLAHGSAFHNTFGAFMWPWCP